MALQLNNFLLYELYGLLDFTYYSPILIFGHRPGFLNNNLVARLVFPLFVVSFVSLGDFVIFFVFRMRLEARHGDHNRFLHFVRYHLAL